MSTIISVGINKSKITFNEQGWANVTIFVNDETNAYGQNASAAMEQSKEQREAKEAKAYIGNGKVVWIKDAQGESGMITLAQKEEKAEDARTAVAENSDLPF